MSQFNLDLRRDFGKNPIRSPVDTLKKYVKAMNKKDTKAMKVVLSKATRKMQEPEAKAQNMSIDEILKRDTLVADVHWITPRAFVSFAIGDLPVSKVIHKKGENICSRLLVQV